MPWLFPTERHIEAIDERDKFDFQSFASKVLHTILLKMEMPNCFGLFGNWGSGKSTVLHFIKEHIEKDLEKCSDIKVVFFEPWKYEYQKEADLLFALLRKIEAELGFKKDDKKSIANRLTVGSWITRNLLGIDVREIKEDMNMWDEFLQTEYEKWADETESFKEEFTARVDKGLKNINKKRLYVFIDDLDRCLPENAVKILEAIKNFLSAQNTIFVIAIDRRVISEMIEKKYGLYDGYGEEYLMKIIHYSIEMPRPNTELLLNEIIEKYGVFFDPKEIKYFSDFFTRFSHQPRRIKHFMYQFIMRYLFGGKRLQIFATSRNNKSGLGHTSRKVDLFVVSFLISKFPKVFAIGQSSEKQIRLVFEKATHPPARFDDTEIQGLLVNNEWQLLRNIFAYGFTNTNNDPPQMHVEQIIDAYDVLSAPYLTDKIIDSLSS